jgi:hypothetical protein
MVLILALLLRLTTQRNELIKLGWATPIPAFFCNYYNMKIRIGNDISLKIQLTFGDSSSANVLSAEAFFVNTTLKNKLEREYKKKNRFIGRFPIEPFTNEFEPSEYCINSTGFPKYKAFVIFFCKIAAFFMKVAAIKKCFYSFPRLRISIFMNDGKFGQVPN